MRLRKKNFSQKKNYIKKEKTYRKNIKTIMKKKILKTIFLNLKIKRYINKMKKNGTKIMKYKT